uniref:XrtA system polysaccharide chain length determinant n=1 Tax=Altererythrobacter segetis TaxID=1104773 RepID=UPI001408DFBC|nr:XrtA system polysaccharide chain length determinant [Altererythrobacter segetis]
MTELLQEARVALWTIWNRRWLALGVAWGVCVLGWLVVALIPNSYQSEARIFVQLDDMLADQIGITAAARDKDIERIRQTLTSSVNLEKIVRSTRLGDTVSNPSQMQTAVAGLTKSIKMVAEGDPGSHVFKITATSGRRDLSDADNAQLSQDIAQQLIDIFKEQNLGGSRGELRDTISFMDQQLAERSKQLEDAEQRRLAFESKYPDLAGGTDAIISQLNGYRAELRNVEADRAAAQSALAAIDGQMASTPKTLDTPGNGGPKAALAQARANLSALQARGLTDSHPDVIAAQKQIAALGKQAQGPGGDYGTPNPAYGSLQSIRVERQATVEALTSRAAALRQQIMTVEANQAQAPAVAGEAKQISRDYEVLKAQYDKLLADREELRLRGQVETEHSSVKFNVIDPPSTPRKPAAPNRPLLLFGVLFIGIAAGCGVAYAASKVRATFATAGKLETTFGLPVIGTVSLAMTDAGRALAKRKRKLFMAAAGSLGGLFVVLLAAEFVQRGMIA